jgi:hypothetical protein
MPGPSAEPLTAGDLLTLEELAYFRRTSSLRGAGLVLHAWGTIAGATALYLLWPSALTLGVAVVMVGARQRSASWCSCTRPPTGSSSRTGG